jgi:hypothetical protein
MSDPGEPSGTTPPAPPPPSSVDPDTRVCVRCGRPATDKDFCVCGANLDAMRAMLPTRAEWESANPEKAALPPPEPPPPGSEPTPRTRPIKWEGKGLPIPMSERMRKQILPSVLVIGVFAAIVIFGSSGSKKGGIQTSTLPDAPTTTAASSAAQTSTTHTTTTATRSTPVAAAPTIASCTTAWNGGRSATHRHILDLAVTADPAPVALLATWRGPEKRLARLGGGSQVLVTANACIVAAHDSVFIQQPSGNWGLVRAAPGSPFAIAPGAPQWGQGRHNATVKVGPIKGGPAYVGAVTPTRQKLPVLR